MGEKGKNVVRKRPTVNIDEIPVNNKPGNRVIIKNVGGEVVRQTPATPSPGISACPRNKTRVTVSYFKSGDPTLSEGWKQRITEVNIIRTKKLTDEFIEWCIANRDKVYIHFEISGMGQTIFEPFIPSVKHSFGSLEKLIRLGFPQRQILVIVNPVLQNENGLKALKLLLRVFTEFKPLRLRYIRFHILQYRQVESGKYVVSNPNILKRYSTRSVMNYLFKNPSFYREYMNVIDRYRAIITVDSGEEALIGVRELNALGYTNRHPDGTPVITYEKNQKWKPEVNVISGTPVRCPNKCLLCPFK